MMPSRQLNEGHNLVEKRTLIITGFDDAIIQILDRHQTSADVAWPKNQVSMSKALMARPFVNSYTQ
jgi:hypothetical protein